MTICMFFIVYINYRTVLLDTQEYRAGDTWVSVPDVTVTDIQQTVTL